MSTRLADHKRRHDAIEDTDPAAASVSLRPRSQRRVVPESLIAPRSRRDGNDTSSTASLGQEDEEVDAEAEGGEKKQRFVWTPDLHHRFEIAVHKLGVANAKPQAIQQLMGCEEDGTIPTRQNIKSHLQKYRLRTGHRSESGRAASSSGVLPTGGAQAAHSGFAPPLQAPLDPIAQKQQTGLLEQLELQKKLDAQLLQQRNTQSALDLRMHTAGPGPTLRPAQLQRLARHVLIMRGMLQHLLTLLHAITVDFCAAGQFAQRSFASGPTQSEDEDECSSFETLMTTSVQSSAGPLVPVDEVGAPGDGQLGLPEIDCTPLQASMADDFDSALFPGTPPPSRSWPRHPLPSADADAEPASAEAMAASAEAITSLVRERAMVAQELRAAQETLPRVLEAQQARMEEQQARAAVGRQTTAGAQVAQAVPVKLEHCVQALAPVAAERSCWPEATMAGAGGPSGAPMPAVQVPAALAPAAHMPICMGEKTCVDLDPVTRCSAIDVEVSGQAVARVLQPKAPTAVLVEESSSAGEESVLNMASDESVPLAVY